MNLQDGLLYLPYSPKALVDVNSEKVIVTIEGMTLSSVITDNATVHNLKHVKLALVPLIDTLDMVVNDDQFGEVAPLDLIAMTRADMERWKDEIKRGVFNHDRLYYWQIKRLAKHNIDYADLIEKDLAVNINKLHDE